MKLDEVTPTYSDPKAIYKVLKAWAVRNTPKIGTLVIDPKYRRLRGVTLYRGIELDRRDIETLNGGDTVDFPSKGFSSWSENVEVAKQFAHDAGASGVVLAVPVEKLKVWLDIDEFLFRNKFPPLDDREEREIIVQDAPLMITKDMLYDND
jgi:hypothetical protein